MVMSWIFTGLISVSLLFATLLGRGQELSAAVSQGAQAGITLVISMAGSICLWAGVGNLMEKAGLTRKLSRLLRPLLGKIFPDYRKNPQLAGVLSANVCANLLGLGSAATPAGIQAARLLQDPCTPEKATSQLCRLVVLNTASIQLIPATVAALRAGLGCRSPYDILPCVWITSILSAGAGLLAAFLLGKLWKT